MKLKYISNKSKNKLDFEYESDWVIPISDNSLIIPEYIINIQNKSKKTLELVEYYERL